MREDRSILRQTCSHDLSERVLENEKDWARTRIEMKQIRSRVNEHHVFFGFIITVVLVSYPTYMLVTEDWLLQPHGELIMMSLIANVFLLVLGVAGALSFE